jgi:hypothetical protein
MKSAVIILSFVIIFTSKIKTISASNADSITWPTDVDFYGSIDAEGYSLEEFYGWYLDNIIHSNVEDTYGLALANLTLGLLKKDPYYIITARSLFNANYKISNDLHEKSLSEFGFKYTERILSGDYYNHDSDDVKVEPIQIEKTNTVPKNFHTITIGNSSIKISKNSLIKVQVDRVTRDWLQAFNIKNSPWNFDPDQVTTWHEGQKIREIVKLTGAKVLPVSGTLVKKYNEDWYAPDAQGIYRFKISEDKVLNFPTTIFIDNQTVIINDTHGISALAWNSLDADLVIGCGDALGKRDAAYYLADNGVNVYMPTDRYIGTLIGTQTKGVILGSAPIKQTNDGAIIGDQSITFEVDEPIVVSNTDGHYPLQYYDTPYRYFKELENYIGKEMNIIPVKVLEYGKATNIIDEARRIGAKLIGIRVKTEYEHNAVYSWLKENKENRVVLFHTAAYPDGYKLFYEFPQQTSFGDIHPVFK